MKTYRLLLVAYRLAGILPPMVMYWLCSLVGSIVYYFVPHIRRAVRDNIRHVLPDSTEHQRRKISRRVIRNVYKNYYDLMRLPRMKREDVEKMVTLEGLELLQEVVDRGKGAILIGGHVGNFSAVAQLAPIKGFTSATIVEDIEPPQLYNFINRLRGHFGLKLIKMGDKQMMTVYRFLRDGGVLAIAADRDIHNTGVRMTFFGEPADLPDGPVVLAMRLGVPLICCYTYRLPNNKNRCVILPEIKMDKTGNYEADLAANMRKVVEFLEGVIRGAPDQWVVLQQVWDEPANPEVPAESTQPAD